jgi:type IV secretory pathway VirJ component
MKFFSVVFCLMMLVVAPAAATPRSVPIDQFDHGLFYEPAGAAPKNFIILLSPSSGWDQATAMEAERLTAAGNAVLGLDVKTYYADRAASEDECLYPSGLLEDIAQQLQKTAAATTFKRPVIIGLGDSGALAAATLLQTLTGTYTSAIAPSFCTTINAPKPLCLGSRLLRQGNSYQPQDIHAVTQSEMLQLAVAPACASERKAWPTQSPAANQAEFIDTSLRQDLALKPADTIAALSDLPLTYLPGKANNDWLVVFISGDGGWRDIDRQISGVLQDNGTSIIGLDSLLYFWHAKTPAETAATLDRIITTGQRAWGKKRVALVGFSFGADMMPFVLPLMKTRLQVKQVSLIALGTDASFEITVDDFLGEGDSQYQTVPALNALTDAPPMLCLYGAEEVADEDTACPLLKQPNVRKVILPGGHHFDNDYPKLARIIATALANSQ